MSNYTIRIWQDGDGHWCEVRLRDPNARTLVKAWTPGKIACARAEARDAIAKHQAERRATRAA